ncbi:MAG: L-threonylcarbamoyladenylate synthase [Puniceicoccaceae bacterium]
MERLRGEQPADRARAARILSTGGLVAVPTETVYGLAAHSLDAAAVRRVFSVKGRPLLDPLIVHFASADAVESFCEIPPAARALADRFWPGPLTLVLGRRPRCGIPDLVSAGLPTLAVRVPAHPTLRALLLESGLPLAAPSANPFGYISPTLAEHVETSLGDRIDAILDGGPCRHGLESTIVAVGPHGSVRLLRPGPVSREAIGALPGIRFAEKEPSPAANPEAPGMLASHYRPAKGIRLFPEGEPPGAADADQTATVFLRRPADPGPGVHWFSEDGESTSIARNLFDLLRKLDRDPDVRCIRVEYPSAGTRLLPAIRDRLSRAAAPLPTEPSPKQDR